MRNIEKQDAAVSFISLQGGFGVVDNNAEIINRFSLRAAFTSKSELSCRRKCKLREFVFLPWRNHLNIFVVTMYLLYSLKLTLYSEDRDLNMFVDTAAENIQIILFTGQKLEHESSFTVK
ncbi:hypothetical protein TNCT_214071 [Trichonephila clavata]|uniref:Uncharacterized protein n=1 Tax=Trichonephila clavata TaxID=2740835 RepID=A0A8X6L7J9_TRICU|nr:hypothetical protein TNCT_214071 [Trichonephila clavata]